MFTHTRISAVQEFLSPEPPFWISGCVRTYSYIYILKIRYLIELNIGRTAMAIYVLTLEVTTGASGRCSASGAGVLPLDSG